MMDEIKLERKKVLDQFKNESELFEKNDKMTSKKLLNEEINNDGIERLENLKKKIIRIKKSYNKLDLNKKFKLIIDENEIISIEKIFGKLVRKNFAIKDFECKKSLNGHTSSVWALKILETGEIASGSQDNSI